MVVAHDNPPRSGGVDPHPIAQAVPTLLIENKTHPGELLSRSKGLQALSACNFTADRGTRAVPGKASDQRDALCRQAKGDPEAPISAITAHKRLAGLLLAVKRTTCRPGWFLNQKIGAFVLSSMDEVEHLPQRAQVLLSERFSAAKATAPAFTETKKEHDALMRQALLQREEARRKGDLRLGVTATRLPVHLDAPPSSGNPIYLASEITGKTKFRELFLSPGCLDPPRRDLVRVISAADTVIHVVVPASGASHGGLP